MLLTLGNRIHYDINGENMVRVTTYTGTYPKGPEFEKWLKENTAEHCERELKKAGERGTRVHNAIECILGGEVLTPISYAQKHEYKKISDETQTLNKYLKEWKMIESFYNWWTDFGRPKPLAVEIQCYSNHLKTAGTIDTIFEIFGRKVMIDWKTSKNIHRNHLIQQGVYWHCAEEDGDIKIESAGVVRLGTQHKTTKPVEDLEKRHTGIGYEYIPITQKDRPGLIKEFKMCQHVWHQQHPDVTGPKTIELMDEISIISPKKNAN